MLHHAPELLLAAIVALFGAAAVCTAIVMRPIIGLYLIFATVLLIERYPFHNTITQWGIVYDNLNTSAGIPGLFLNPVELLLGLMLVGVALRAIMHPGEGLRIQTVSFLGILYGGWMLFSVLWGLVNGGNWKVALWIVRPVFYFLTISFLSFQLIRRPQQAMVLLWIAIVCVTIKSLQIIIRKYTLGLELEAYGEHEDTSFALFVAWIGLSMLFLPFPKVPRRVIAVLLPIIVFGIICNDRRINIATGAIGAMMIFGLQSRAALWRRRMLIGTAAVFGFLYLVVGWFGPTTPITAPVKGFKQGIRAELLGENTDNSSWYRKVERFNLRHTVRSSPILGTGLGVRYKQIIRLDTLTFDHYVYITHNQVLLVHSTTGAIGYFLFLTFFTALSAQLAIYYRWLDEGWQRAIALAALLSILNWLCVAYYDLQLFFYRNSLFMGTIVGIPAALFRYRHLLPGAPTDAPTPADGP